MVIDKKYTYIYVKHVEFHENSLTNCDLFDRNGNVGWIDFLMIVRFEKPFENLILVYESRIVFNFIFYIFKE